jgi:hypothetical protein
MTRLSTAKDLCESSRQLAGHNLMSASPEHSVEDNLVVVFGMSNLPDGS